MTGAADKAAAWAEKIAADSAHGYDQGERWGPDYDCSSLVISAYEQAGVPVLTGGATYTGNMRNVFLRCGFADVTSQVDRLTGARMQRGDVLLNELHHTAICIGSGKIVQARVNERGEVTGGRSGDQTGREIELSGYYNFPWDVVLRYKEESEPSETPDHTGAETDESGIYVVQPGDNLWDIAERLLGSGTKYGDIMAENELQSILIYPGQTLRIPSGGKTTITVTVRSSTAAALEQLAKDSGLTVGECIDALF